MTAHLCAHSGVCSAPQTGWARQKSGGGAQKIFFRRLAPEFVPIHFQFASGASGGTYYKIPAVKAEKHIFLHGNASNLVLKILQHDKIWGDNRPSKFWGTCPPVLLPRDLRPWGLGYWAVCLFNTPILSVVCV